MKESDIYPGAYRPSSEMEKMIDGTDLRGKLSGQLLIRMKETPDCFVIELATAEITRENIFMHIHDHLLSIVILPKGDNQEKGNNNQTIELEGEFIEEHLVLPQNADPDFISAEFKNGRLCLHIAKTSHECEVKEMPIAIY